MMLKYIDLSKGQRRWVELVEQYFSDLLVSSDGILTYTQIKMIHAEFLTMRKTGKQFKISKPLWLISNNALSRGFYKFPSSTEQEEPDAPPTIISDMEIIYRAELKKMGISVKNVN